MARMLRPSDPAFRKWLDAQRLRRAAVRQALTRIRQALAERLRRRATGAAGAPDR
jgi:hypothetical protein